MKKTLHCKNSYKINETKIIKHKLNNIIYSIKSEISVKKIDHNWNWTSGKIAIEDINHH